MTLEVSSRPYWIARLREAVRTGLAIDESVGIDEEGQDPTEDEDVLSAIPAEAIRHVLLTPGLRFDPQGLQIQRAVITGTMNFDFATIPCRLCFDQCRFDEAPSF